MKKIGIVGATGYTGEELLKLLSRHNNVQAAFVTSEKEAGQPLANIYPHLPIYSKMQFISVNDAVQIAVDLVFLCLPAGDSAKLAKEFHVKNIKIIDLGADFRFNDSTVYKEWYSMDHVTPELLPDAVYGLPEWYRENIKKANLVGNPGCYPTCSLLAVLPLLEADVIESSPIIIDAKSGVSGAGKTPSPTTHFVQVNENFNAYKAGRIHRHVGEMENEMKKISTHPVQVIFTPHLTPITRGMYSTIYVKLKNKTVKSDVINILKNKYDNSPFIHVLEQGIPSIKMAANTNYCFIGAETVKGSDMLILFSAIDNLGKGASAQAVQNMNLMLGFDESEGLL